MRTRLRLCRFLAQAVLTAIVFATPSVHAQCKKDTDCKGTRICVDGVCVYPKAETKAGASAARKSGIDFETRHAVCEHVFKVVAGEPGMEISPAERKRLANARYDPEIREGYRRCLEGFDELLLTRRELDCLRAANAGADFKLCPGLLDHIFE